jgi:TetR/AcrR family transcriptional regulator
MSTIPDERRPGRPAGQDATDVRRKLLDATRDACISRGLDRVSSKEIAAAAGVNPAMINYYFGSREELNKTMMLDALSPLLAQLSAAEDNVSRLTFGQFLRAYMGALAANAWLPKLVVREVLPDNGRLRELFLTQVGQRAARIFPELLKNELGTANVPPRLDPTMLALSLVSLAIFPFVAAPIVAPVLGLDFEDAAVLERLIEHTVGIADRVLVSEATP